MFLVFIFRLTGMATVCFLATKRALGVHTADNQDHPYYLTRYFRRQVVVWLVQN